MRFFFDRSTSIQLCRMTSILEKGKHELVHHDEDSRFTQHTADTEWIAAIAKDRVKPIVIAGDGKILRRPIEVEALREANLTFFYLSDHWPQLGLSEMAWKVFKVWPEIIKHAAVADPTVFEICAGKSLKIEEYRKTSQLKSR